MMCLWKNLREACLQLVVCARARARELQVDVQVERASRAVVTAHTVTPTKGRTTPAMEPAVCKFFLTAEGCKFGDDCKYKHPRTTGKCLCFGAEGHSLSTCTRPSKTKSGSSSKQSTKGKGRSTMSHDPVFWRQIWRVAGRESDSPELLGSPRTSPEVPQTSPEVFRRLPRKFSHCGA